MLNLVLVVEALSMAINALIIAKIKFLCLVFGAARDCQNILMAKISQSMVHKYICMLYECMYIHAYLVEVSVEVLNMPIVINRSMHQEISYIHVTLSISSFSIPSRLTLTLKLALYECQLSSVTHIYGETTLP